MIKPTSENVSAALSFLSADCDRDEWFRIAAAVKDGLNGEGFAVFDDFSRNGQTYDAKDCKALWDSIGDGDVRIGTLFDRALKAGWKPEADAREETEAEHLERERKHQKQQREAAEAEARKHRMAATLAHSLYDQADECVGHAYLEKKGVLPVPGLRVVDAVTAIKARSFGPSIRKDSGRLLLVPIHRDGGLQSLEAITGDGGKGFLAGGKKSGGWFQIDEIREGSPLVLVEGLATGISIWMATGDPVRVCFDAGNLKAVAERTRADHPELAIVIAADLDPNGAGQRKAEAAARAVGGYVVTPNFEGLSTREGDTDFNDFHQIAGLEAVKNQFGNQITGYFPENGLAQQKAFSPGAPPISADLTDDPDFSLLSSEMAVTAVTPVTDLILKENIGNQAVTSPVTTVTGLNLKGKSESQQKTPRPGYGVYDGKTEFGKPGVYYHGIKEKKDSAEPFDLWICGPLHIEAQCCDRDHHNFGLMLKFRNMRGQWKQWAMPMHLLAGDGVELRRELLSLGLRIDHHNRGYLLSYLQSRAECHKWMESALSVGWHGAAFVLPDVVIGNRADIFFQSEHAFQKEYAEAGTLDEWRGAVAQNCIDNPLLLFSLASAFAGALLKPCHIDGGGIHVFGDSSKGKSTGQKAAASVWGGEGYRRSWRATANGMEGAAALFNDGLLCLDEIGDGDAREINQVIYALGNGIGKQRASVYGTARQVNKWRVLILSNGEKTLEAHLAEKGLTAKAGQLVRLLQIPLLGKHGAFDELHGCADGREFSDRLQRNAATYYGTAGLAYLERLTRESRDLGGLHARLLSAFDKVGALTSQEQRAARTFAVIALGGELATEYGITGWPEGTSIEAALACFKAWRGHRGEGDTEPQQIKSAITDYLDRYGDARFTDISDDTRLHGERSGYWRDTYQGREWLFSKAGLMQAATGFDLKQVVAVLKGCGWLQLDGQGYSTKPVNFRNNETNERRLYAVIIKNDCNAIKTPVTAVTAVTSLNNNEKNGNSLKNEPVTAVTTQPVTGMEVTGNSTTCYQPVTDIPFNNQSSNSGNSGNSKKTGNATEKPDPKANDDVEIF